MPGIASHRMLRRRRWTALTLTILIELGILLAVLLGRWEPPVRIFEAQRKVFNVESLPAERPAQRSQTRIKAEQAARPKAQPPAIRPPLIVKPSRTYVPVTTEDFAAGDISKLPRAATGATGTGTAYGPQGGGPGNAVIYAAQWYREPTRGELSHYFRDGDVKPGWGEVVCQTIAHYHVENCQMPSESPGSGIARALRLASWQFLVIPPRVNGRAMVGAWVRIHFDLRAEAPD